MPRHHKLPLNDAQLAVLGWIADGCPDGVMEGYSHRISAAALRSRGLVRITGRGKTWQATITPAGTERLEAEGVAVPVETRAPREPVPAKKAAAPKERATTYVSVTTALVRAVVEAGGVLTVSGADYTEHGKYERRAREANRLGKVPAGKRLVVESDWRQREFEVRLEDAIPGTDVEPSPVPVPARLTKPHPVTARFREQKDYHEVSRAQLSRSLRIVQAIVREAERRGFTVENVVATPERRRRREEWTGPEDGHLRLARGDDSFRLRIHEEGLRSRAMWQRDKSWYESSRGSRWGSGATDPGAYDRGATGRLVVTLNSGYSQEGRPSKWADRQRWTLEQKLPELFRELEIRTAEAAHRRMEAERAAAERQRRWEAAMEKAKERFVEAYRAEQLSAQVASSQRAKAIRDYCDALEAGMGEDSPTTEEQRAWIEWGREHAASIDPVSRPQVAPTPPEIKPEDLKPFLEGWSPYGPSGW